MSDERAAAFNAFTANWISRIDSMNNSVILVVGGIMSITIGAYLSSNPPNLDSCAMNLIRWAWILLAVSLSGSISLKFLLVISGAITLRKWEQNIKVESDGRVVIDSPAWVHWAGWIFGICAVSSCLVGIILIAIGAGALL